MISYPQIDPIIFQLGPFALRWYSLAYIGGIFFGFKLFKKEFIEKIGCSEEQIMSLMTYMIVGVIVGGRLGYVLIYDWGYYQHHLAELGAIWKGGMSYHGGAVGALVGFLLFGKIYQKNALKLLDILGIGSTIGMGLGRLANFINGELVGRITDVPWGMVFPGAGPYPRHPSQLYEFCLEGVVLFTILWWIHQKEWLKPGQLFALYLVFYGLFRFGVEFFRQPDTQLGLVLGTFSMGQVLCMLMIGLGGGFFSWLALKNKGSQL